MTALDQLNPFASLFMSALALPRQPAKLTIANGQANGVRPVSL